VLRLLLEQAVPDGVVVSETNVPEAENLSYVRPGDEAHLAYNFPLPPLLLEALISGRADLLNQWLVRWPELPAGTGLLNFSACHDGVGLRPLEGLMGEDRLLRLLRACERRGGLVSHRRLPDGTERPYELNISWWSAMQDRGPDRSRWQQERFLVSQLLVMALPGVPAFYLPAVLASANDRPTFARTGHRRDLHRERFDADRLERILADPESPASINVRRLQEAMAIRRGLPAFHPESPMLCLSGHRPTLVVLRRGRGEDAVWAVHSLTSANTNLNLNTLLEGEAPMEGEWSWVDRLADRSLLTRWLALGPYEVFWLQRQRQRRREGER
jgi:sucrose phosphorylase